MHLVGRLVERVPHQPDEQLRQHLVAGARIGLFNARVGRSWYGCLVDGLVDQWCVLFGVVSHTHTHPSLFPYPTHLGRGQLDEHHGARHAEDAVLQVPQAQPRLLHLCGGLCLYVRDYVIIYLSHKNECIRIIYIPPKERPHAPPASGAPRGGSAKYPHQHRHQRYREKGG